MSILATAAIGLALTLPSAGALVPSEALSSPATPAVANEVAPSDFTCYVGEECSFSVGHLIPAGGYVEAYAPTELPLGMSLDSYTGIISGTPEKPGPHLLLFQAYFADGTPSGSGVWSFMVSTL